LVFLTTTSAVAGNLDRNKRPVDLIFEKGNRAELTMAVVAPNVTGQDSAAITVDDVGENFGSVAAGVKLQFGQRLSFAMIYDQPYGADTRYDGSPTTTLFGGALSQAESVALTVLLRYDVTDRIAVYGGPRLVQAQGNITLSGLAYGPLNGYDVKFSKDSGLGYAMGAAYEIPEIAFRAALTYHSDIDLEMQTTETFPGAAPIFTGATPATMPQSVKLQVQSGVAENTLVFGSIYWSEWSKFTLDPNSAVTNLAVLDDAWTYEIGVGRRFTDSFSARVSYSYEHEEGSSLVSPLAPFKGSQTVTLGGTYQLTQRVDISGGISYTWLGEALLETSPTNVVRGNFDDNRAFGAGFRVGLSF
jgi:long-subunit fatty acid transport protein